MLCMYNFFSFFFIIIITIDTRFINKAFEILIITFYFSCFKQAQFQNYFLLPLLLLYNDDDDDDDNNNGSDGSSIL